MPDGTAYGEIQFNDSGSIKPRSLCPPDGTMLTTSNCGGVLLDEDWTVTYDGRSGDWLIEGSGQENKIIALFWMNANFRQRCLLIFTHQWWTTTHRWRPICLFHFK